MAGAPRDCMVPFYNATTPHSYIGWGKTTHLGFGIPLMIGAKMACPDKMCVNLMGDGAFGMSGTDLETSARSGAAITTVLVRAHHSRRRTTAQRPTLPLPLSGEQLRDGNVRRPRLRPDRRRGSDIPDHRPVRGVSGPQQGRAAVDAVGCVDDERRLRQDRRGNGKHLLPLLFLLLLFLLRLGFGCYLLAQPV